MEFNFYYKTETEKKELDQVINCELDKHFKDNLKYIQIHNSCRYENIESNNYTNDYVQDGFICIYIPNSLYIEDLELSKQKLYENRNNIINNFEKTNGGTNICLDISGLYLKDFLSEVQENLSFVPEKKVLDKNRKKK